MLWSKNVCKILLFLSWEQTKIKILKNNTCTGNEFLFALVNNSKRADKSFASGHVVWRYKLVPRGQRRAVYHTFVTFVVLPTRNWARFFFFNLCFCEKSGRCKKQKKIKFTLWVFGEFNRDVKMPFNIVPTVPCQDVKERNPPLHSKAIGEQLFFFFFHIQWYNIQLNVKTRTSESWWEVRSSIWFSESRRGTTCLKNLTRGIRDRPRSPFCVLTLRTTLACMLKNLQKENSVP